MEEEKPIFAEGKNTQRDSRTQVEKRVTILKDTDEILIKSNDEADLKHKIT